MKGKKTTGGGDFEDTQSIPIDFGTLLSEDVSSSGSFYVNEVQTTSLGTCSSSTDPGLVD